MSSFPQRWLPSKEELITSNQIDFFLQSVQNACISFRPGFGPPSRDVRLQRSNLVPMSKRPPPLARKVLAGSALMLNSISPVLLFRVNLSAFPSQLSDRNIQGKLVIDVIVEFRAPPHKMGFDQCRNRISSQHLAFFLFRRNL